MDSNLNIDQHQIFINWRNYFLTFSLPSMFILQRTTHAAMPLCRQPYTLNNVIHSIIFCQENALRWRRHRGKRRYLLLENKQMLTRDKQRCATGAEMVDNEMKGRRPAPARAHLGRASAGTTDQYRPLPRFPCSRLHSVE
jgi:hypothetical protein